MKHRMLLIGGVAVLLAGGIGYLAGRGGPSTLDQAPGGLSGSADDAKVASPARAARDAARTHAIDNTAPLPDIDTPLAQIHDTLVRRAAAGEARAACRLAAEHERCEMSRSNVRALVVQLDQYEAWVANNAARLPEDRRKSVAERREQLDRERAAQQDIVTQCDAATPLSPEARARYWRQAALAGHVPSMRHYAIGNGFRWQDLMDAVPALQIYRREAESIARRAAMHGDAASMYALAMAYADLDGGRWRPFLAQTITPDLAEALAWFTALSRHPAITALPDRHPTATNVARQLATLQAAATPSETARAARLSAAISIPAAQDAPTVSIRPDGGIHDIGREACDETGFVDSASSRTKS